MHQISYYSSGVPKVGSYRYLLQYAFHCDANCLRASICGRDGLCIFMFYEMKWRETFLHLRCTTKVSSCYTSARSSITMKCCNFIFFRLLSLLLRTIRRKDQRPSTSHGVVLCDVERYLEPYLLVQAHGKTRDAQCMNKKVE